MNDKTDYEHIKVNVIAVDFDGVIHLAYKGWNGGKLYGNLAGYAREVISELQTKGYEVVVCTARDDLDIVRKWLKKHNICCEVTNKKIPCLAIIDDRAIRFTNWQDIRTYFV